MAHFIVYFFISVDNGELYGMLLMKIKMQSSIIKDKQQGVVDIST